MSLLTEEVRKRVIMERHSKIQEDLRGVKSCDEGSGAEGQKEQLPGLFEADFLKLISSRRNFLKLLGFSFTSAAIIAACKRPVHMAIPYVIQPPEITPGKPLYYATTFYDGHEYSAILVKTRDGRPIKIEGNSLSSFNREGTTARVQASVLSLYDDARLKSPSVNQQPASWESIDAQILNDITGINSDGGEIVLLTPSLNSPATLKLINEFGGRFKNFRWVQYDSVSYSAVLEANAACFGRTVIPDYHFQDAGLVVSVNADFLGTWVAPVHFIPKYTARRKLNNGEKSMLRHIHFESGMSITGGNADIRRKIKPSEEIILLADLYNKIAQKTGAETFHADPFREDLSELADNLIASKGRSVVVSGTNNIDIQIITNGINFLLGNYDHCIDLNNYLNISSGIDKKMEDLVNDLDAGRIKALLMYNVNPAYDYPQPDKFLSGLKKTLLTVNMAGYLNETNGKAKFECPVHHFLESWNDAEITPGRLSLSQPCINPLFNTRSFHDSLLKWSGNPISWHDYLMANWEKEFFPQSALPEFKKFWDTCLGNGVFSYDRQDNKTAIFKKEELSRVMNNLKVITAEVYEVVFFESIALGTGMYSNNPWLMELPDPVSKHCWDNVAAISPKDAEELGILSGQLIKLGDTLILPAFIQPGQAEGTVSVALGYGHSNNRSDFR